jgi:hypothetical protein
MRTFLYIVLVASIIANAALALKLLDCASSLDDARAQVREVANDRQLHVQIIQHDWKGRPLSDADELGKGVAAQGAIVKREGSALTIGDLEFVIAADKVVSVRSIR